MKIMVVSSPHAFATRDVYTGHLAGLTALLGEANVKSYDIIPRFNLFHAWSEWLVEVKGVPADQVPRGMRANVLAADAVFGAAHWYEIDALYFVSPMYFPMSIVDMLRKDGFKCWAYFTECPYEDEYWSRSQTQHFDACFVNDRNSVNRFRVWNPNTYHIAHAFNPAVHYARQRPDNGHNHIVYVGTGFPERRKFLEQIDWADRDLRLYGNWQEIEEGHYLYPHVRHRLVDNETTAQLYRGASTGLSMHRIERHWGDGQFIDPGEAYSLGPRSYELAACGLFQLSDERPELWDVFGDSVPTFATPEDLDGLMRKYDNAPGDRAALAKRQWEAVQPHTVQQRMRDLLALVA